MVSLLLLIGPGCSDYQLKEQLPDLQINATALDFDEVVVGTQRTGTLALINKGRGDLHLDSVSLGGSADFALVDSAPEVLEPGDELSLSIRYAPDIIGPDDGRLQVVSDDADQPTLEVPLTGQGVEPEIDLDPETLWYGYIPVGSSETRSVDVNARGQGSLRIDDIGFVSDEGEAFSIALPEDLTLPATLSAGTGFSFDVIFTPVDDRAWDGAVYLLTNDPSDAEVHVTLLANTDATGEEPPTVEITAPDWGNQLLYGQPTTLIGSVVDDADAPDSLVALWYANDLLLGTSIPDSAGAVSLETSDLPLGDVTLRLAALDLSGNVGDDEVEFSVYDPDEPMPYFLTGGSSIWDYWSVDDDVMITLDGEKVFLDVNHTHDSHPPLELEARAGQELRIVATDYNYCDQSLDALTLHWGTGASQTLNEAQCRSACPSHPCYDPDFVGPWPGIFFDATYTIEIP